jgi:hypothetical protein
LPLSPQQSLGETTETDVLEAAYSSLPSSPSAAAATAGFSAQQHTFVFGLASPAAAAAAGGGDSYSPDTPEGATAAAEAAAEAAAAAAAAESDRRSKSSRARRTTEKAAALKKQAGRAKGSARRTADEEVRYTFTGEMLGLPYICWHMHCMHG